MKNRDASDMSRERGVTEAAVVRDQLLSQQAGGMHM